MMSEKHDIIANNQPRLSELISLQEAAEFSSLTQGHIAHLIRQGEIWGKKIGRNWVPAIQTVNEFNARRKSKIQKV